MEKTQDLPKSKSRQKIGGLLCLVGLLIWIWGCFLGSQNPRTTADDNFSWLVSGIGVTLGSFGFFFRFLHAAIATVIALISPVVLFFFSSALIWTWILTSGFFRQDHSELVAKAKANIEVPAQMEELFGECKHYITYGEKDVPLLNSLAYFGGRYELRMYVPLGSTGAMSAPPEFLLLETEKISVSPSGPVSTSYARNKRFALKEWEELYRAKGDFTVIGFKIDPTEVPNFEKHAASGRPSD